MADIKTVSGKEYHLCWCEDGGVEDLEIKILHAQSNKTCTTTFDKGTHDAIATDDYQKVLDKIIEKNLKDEKIKVKIEALKLKRKNDLPD